MHLEGAMTPELLYSLASRNSISLPDPATNPIYASQATYAERLSKTDAYDDLASFLELYFIAVAVLRYETDFHELAMTYFRRAARDNVRHAEVFFDAQSHTDRGVPLSTVIAGFKSACAEAEANLGMTTKLIMCFVRHLPPIEAVEAYKAARPDLLNGSLGGIGLASEEKGYPPELFTDLYDLAVKDGIHRTAHAGEEVGPESVIGALEHLHAERIDHGRTIPQDPNLLKRVSEDQTLITLCPLSNLKLQGVKSLEQLPVRVFLDAGVKFSINSDDPGYFGGWTLDNYCAVQSSFNLTIDEWRWICTAAIEGSWCDEGRRNELMQELEKVIIDFRP